ncbi:MAG: phosphoenolpyruvate--protein phosphotransferase [Desulfovibrio sp.]
MARRVLNGISVSTGIAIGRAYFINRSYRAKLPRREIAPIIVDSEIERLQRAFDAVKAELTASRENMPEELREHQLIIDSYLLMLEDPKLRKASCENIQKRSINAEWALEEAVLDLEKAFSALDNEYIRERIQDVELVFNHVLAELMGKQEDLSCIEGRVIILAHDLTPADTVKLEISRIMAFATIQGGKTSHTGILARTLTIPAIVGVERLEEQVDDGELIVIDGITGHIVVGPSEEELEAYFKKQVQFETYQRKIIRECNLPAETKDGHSVQVVANIELIEEVTSVLDYGGEGVGLYRTEYSYMNRDDLPTEDELAETYTDLASILEPRKTVFRTLDLGADKFVSSYGRLNEANPAMGLRAIRFCLRHRDMFREQIRAILRASPYGDVCIMFPMISGLQELRQAKQVLFQCMKELKAEGHPFNPDIPVGIMVELPAAVMVAEFLAEEVDFFSIGTNDLIQYSLGIDRTNHHVSYLYQPLHPAIVRAIKHVVDAGHQAGIEVSLCGEVASDPYCVPILMGMDIDCLSLSPQAIPGIKRIIRQTTMEDCKTLLREVIKCRTVPRINSLVRKSIFTESPEELAFYTSLLDSDELGG